LSRNVAVLIFVTLLGAIIGVAPALAYDEVGSGLECSSCHGLDEGETTLTVNAIRPRKGPHGGYTTGTQKCQTCHTLHAAPLGSILLLPAATIKDTCNSCHDGTGGKGVYGALAAQGVPEPPGGYAGHAIEETNLVPGGSPTGGEDYKDFSASGGLLTCSDCHSPHDSNTVEPYTGDRVRVSDPEPMPTEEPADAVKTNRLLKRSPTTSLVEVAVYGSNWCGTCHVGRLYGSAGVNNHPVETETAGVYYDNVVRVSGPNTTDVEWGSLGGSNRGYVMPTSTVEPPGRFYPICQQCHEDSRSVGNDPAYPQQISTLNGFDEEFTVTAADGAVATDNPRFQVFPHESDVPRMLVEPGNSLCLNCHD
jgi:hypothetical protein